MYRILLFVLVAISTLTCKKDERRGVDILFRRDFEIQAGIGPFVVHHYYLNNIPSTYKAVLQANSLQDSMITNIFNSNGELSTIFGDTDLNFITRISIRIFEEGNPGNYIEVAYRDPAPNNSNATLGLVPSLADVKSFITKDRFGIDVAVEVRNITTENVPVRLDLKFKAEY